MRKRWRCWCGRGRAARRPEWGEEWCRRPAGRSAGAPPAGREELGTDRIPGHDSVGPLEPRQRILKRHRHRGDEPRDGAVREPGERVRLVDDRRDAAEPCRDEDRSRRVAADAEDDARLVFADEPPGLDEAFGNAQDVADEIEPAFPFEAADVDELEREAGLRDDRLLESPLGADEDRAPLRIAREVLARNGDGGIDVPSRPTACNHQHTLHAHHALTRIVARNSAGAPRP